MIKLTIPYNQVIKMIIDRNYEERLYSTGSDELDELLEKAFCDGYEYAQREFNSKSQKAMRRKLDILQGGGFRSDSDYGTVLALRNGRRQNQRNNDITYTIDSSINSKAVNTLDGDINASSFRLINPERGVSKKDLKKFDRYEYDHGSKSRPTWNKEVMEIRKDKKTEKDLADIIKANKRDNAIYKIKHNKNLARVTGHRI